MILLAQETFESYKEIGTHPEFFYDLVNPFNPEFLLEPGNFFNPWVASVTVYTVWGFLLGALLLWIYYRLNDASVFLNLGVTLLSFSVLLPLFFRKAFPHPGGLLLATLCFLSLVVNLTTVIGVAAVQKLPYFGVDEKALSDPKTGAVRPYLLYLLATVLLLVPYFSFRIVAWFLYALVGHSSLLAWTVLLLMIALAGYLGTLLLPWREVPGQTILGGGPLKELAPIFSMPGPATREEVVMVGLGTFVLYAGVLFMFKGFGSVSAADILGLVMMSLMAFNIMRAELDRSAKTQQKQSGGPPRPGAGRR